MSLDTTLFWSFFVLTLVALAISVVSGLRQVRRLHLAVAPISMVLLAVAIVFAERMAAVRSFPPDEMAIHLWFAKSAAVLALGVVATGLFLWRNPKARRIHLVCVVLFLVAAVTASATGVWVFGLSTPK